MKKYILGAAFLFVVLVVPLSQAQAQATNFTPAQIADIIGTFIQGMLGVGPNDPLIICTKAAIVGTVLPQCQQSSQTTPTNSPLATIHQNSVVTDGGAFSITGVAKNTSNVTVFLAPSNYSTYASVNNYDTIANQIQIGKDGFYKTSSVVSYDRWTASFNWSATSISFLVLVYDTASKQLLTTGTLLVNVPQTNTTTNQPSVTSISSPSVSGTTATFFINGSGFQSGATVSYSGNSAGNYNATFSASFVSSTKLSVTGTGLTPNSSYTLFVRNPNGQTSAGCFTYTSCSSALSVAAPAQTAPDITINGASGGFSLSPTVEFGRTFTFNWSVAPTIGTTCAAAGIGINGGSGAINLGGSWTTPALYATTTYGVKCTNSLGTTYKYVKIGVQAQTNTTTTGNTAPTITLNGNNTSPRLSINVEFGRTATFTWGVSPTSGTACAAAGIGVNGATGSGAVALSGQWTTPALYTNTTYGIACANTNSSGVVSGTTYKYADVTVAPQANTVTAAPTINSFSNSFTSTPVSVTSGQPTALRWDITPSGTGTTCKLSETSPVSRIMYDYGRMLLSSSNTSTYDLTANTTYRIDCRNNEGWTSWKAITIPVTAAAAPVATACTWSGTYVGVWGAGCNATVPAGTTVQSGQTSGLIYNTASGYTTNTSYIQYSCTNGQFAPVNPVCVTNVAPVNTTAPTISYFYPISASVTSGTAPTLDWYVTPASGTTATCSMTGNWGGSLSQGLRPVSAGGWGANNITSATTYTLTCTNTAAGGSSTSRTTSVAITAPATAPADSTAVSCRWDGGLIGPWGSGCNANVGQTTVASGGSTGTINNTTAGYTGYVSFNCISGSFTVASQYCAPLTASALNALGSTAQSPSITQVATGGFSYTFTQDMYRGVQGNEVVALQRALHEEGLFAGEATGNFYDVTREAVMAFQIKYGINPTGYVGPETRAKLNALY